MPEKTANAEVRIGELQVGVGDRILRTQKEHPDKTDIGFNLIKGYEFGVTEVSPGHFATIKTNRPVEEWDRKYSIPESKLTREYFVILGNTR